MPTFNMNDLFSELDEIDETKNAQLCVEPYTSPDGIKMYFVVALKNYTYRDVAYEIGMNYEEYIFYIIKEFNALYNKKLNCFYFTTEEEANTVLEWAEGIKLMTTLQIAGE